MKSIICRSTLGIVAMACVAGCQATGENLRADVYSAGQVNSAQEAQVIEILAVLPAKVSVDNSHQKRMAQTVAAIAGAGAGGVLGSRLRFHSYGATLGVIGGGAAGAALGSLVPKALLVEGVSLTYEQGGRNFNSAQVGRSCEYKAGRAVMFSTTPTETRIQPNAVCADAKKS